MKMKKKKVAIEKSHKIYNEKLPNNSLERIIWNNYTLSQNYSILKILISKLWMLSIRVTTQSNFHFY